MEKYKISIIVVAILAGFIINGYFVGRAIQRFRKEDRYISVKGFAEREVKANLAVWNINTRITSNDLIEGSTLIENNKQKIYAFLLGNGIKSSEIVQQNLNVTDKFAREYNNSIVGDRYVIENTIQVRTANVDTISYVSKLTDELLKAGIVIDANYDYNPTVKYLFTDLNKIKPQMLSEAIKNARQAANEFAKESKMRLGILKKANQGLFSIIDRDYSSTADNYYSSNERDIYKVVRVVVNVEYSIE